MSRIAAIAAVIAGTAAGCARSEIVAPEAAAAGQVTVDASAAWAYVDLGAGTSVAPADPSTSGAWDIGFNATSVMLNGGVNGPGGVTGFCVCQNAGATNEQILQMTPDNQESAFESVNSAAISTAAGQWSNDVFTTSVWYRYDLAGDHRISPTFDVYLVKRGTTVYKLQLINYYSPAGSPRQITVRYSKVQG